MFSETLVRLLQETNNNAENPSAVFSEYSTGIVFVYAALHPSGHFSADVSLIDPTKHRRTVIRSNEATAGAVSTDRILKRPKV